MLEKFADFYTKKNQAFRLIFYMLTINLSICYLMFLINTNIFTAWQNTIHSQYKYRENINTWRKKEENFLRKNLGANFYGFHPNLDAIFYVLLAKFGANFYVLKGK